MNYTKALMGLTLFASINTFTMNMDINQAHLAEYILACGICGKKMSTPYESIKKVFHGACIMTMANAPYFTNNPIVAENEAAWTVSHASTTDESTPATSKKTWGNHGKTRRNRWSN